MIQLWHCNDTRSMRVLWTLEALGLDYQLHNMDFPPRIKEPDFLKVNPLGTVPFFKHQDMAMTESCGICLYLSQTCANNALSLTPEHPEYGIFLDWITASDATLTFPLTLVLRYQYFEPSDELTVIAESYKKWFLSRLKKAEFHLEGKQYLVDDRFTVADICLGYSLFLADILGLSIMFKPNVAKYYRLLLQEKSLQKTLEKQESTHNFGLANMLKQLTC